MLITANTILRQNSNVVRLLSHATRDAVLSLHQRFWCRANGRLTRPQIRGDAYVYECRWSTLIFDCPIKSSRDDDEFQALSEIALVGEHQIEHPVCAICKQQQKKRSPKNIARARF